MYTRSQRHIVLNENPRNSDSELLRKRPLPESFDQSDIEDEEPLIKDEEHSQEGKFNLEKLMETTLGASVSQIWEEAVEEWEFLRVFQEPNGTCICGHSPITDHCVIKNEHNGNELIVGNVCLKQFKKKIREEAAQMFGSYKRLLKDLSCRSRKELRQRCLEKDENERYEALLEKKPASDEEKKKKKDEMKKLNLKMIERWNFDKHLDCEKCTFPSLRLYFEETDEVNGEVIKDVQILFYECLVCFHEYNFHEGKKAPKSLKRVKRTQTVPRAEDLSVLEASDHSEEQQPQFVENILPLTFTYNEDGERIY